MRGGSATVRTTSARPDSATRPSSSLNWKSTTAPTGNGVPVSSIPELLTLTSSASRNSGPSPSPGMVHNTWSATVQRGARSANTRTSSALRADRLPVAVGGGGPPLSWPIGWSV